MKFLRGSWESIPSPSCRNARRNVGCGVRWVMGVVWFGGKGVAYLFCLSRPEGSFVSRKRYIRASLSPSSEWPRPWPYEIRTSNVWFAHKSSSAFDRRFPLRGYFYVSLGPNASSSVTYVVGGGEIVLPATPRLAPIISRVNHSYYFVLRICAIFFLEI